jgi:Holliday junction resolvasome RuvABC ATP-dependent DNA helicase subunit
MINKAFDTIIGQTRAKTMLSMSAEAGKGEREMLSLLIKGPAGLGKTRLGDAYVEALLESNPNMKALRIQPRDIRLIGEEFNNVITAIVSGDPYVLFIDECHELVTDNTKQLKTIFSFIRKALDGNNKGKLIHIQDEQFAIFDRRKHVIIMATNFPHLLDKSGALQSRLNVFDLDLYTEEEMVKITELMAENSGIVFNITEKENPVKRIAKCGRGTARFVERVMEQLSLVNDGEPITEKQVFTALRNLKMYPRGLNEKEILLLKVAATHPINKGQFSVMAQVDVAEMKPWLAYLTHPNIRFITQLPNGLLETTKVGKTYLTKCKEIGFQI